MAKGKGNNNEPPMYEILEAIEEKRGKHNDIPSQLLFLRGLLVPKYTGGLSDAEIEHKAEKLRQTILRRTSVNSRVYHERGTPKRYGITHLFVLGPREIFWPKYLDGQGCEFSDTSDDEYESESQTEGHDDEGEDEESHSQIRLQHAEVSKSSTVKRLGKSSTTDDTPVQKATSRDGAVPPSRHLQPSSDTVHLSTTRDSSKNSSGASVKTQKRAYQATAPALSSDRSGHEKRRKLAGTDEHSESEMRSSDANSEEVQEWVRSAGHRTMPAIPPTRPPANMAGMNAVSDKPWLTERVDQLERAIWEATKSYNQKYAVQKDARSEFVVDPSPALEKLYESLIRGDKRWQAWLVSQASPKAPRQDYAVMGLFGVAIYETIIRSDLPWDVKKDIPKALGANVDFVNAVIEKMGSDMETFLQNVSGEMIANENFQKTTVAQEARTKAGAVAQIMRRHLQELKKCPNPTTLDTEMLGGQKSWIQWLEEAFREAIIIKQTLRDSKLGPFVSRWPAAGDPFDPKQHRALFAESGAQEILHTVLPGFSRKLKSGEEVPFTRALVILPPSS